MRPRPSSHGFNTRVRDLLWRFFWRFFSITSAHDMPWTHALDFFALRKGFTVVVAELVAVSVAVVAAVVVLVEVADRLDVDPKKRIWAGLADTQFTNNPIFSTIRMLLSKGTTIRLGQRQKSNSFSILGVAYITRHSMVKSIGEGRKRDKWVPNNAYFCAMVLK